MSGGPDNTDDEPEDTTLIVPNGASRPQPNDPAAAWPEEDERTRIIQVPDDERTQIINAPFPPPPAGATPPPSTAVWDEVASPPPAPPPPGDLAPNTVLGNYRVGNLIARGGLGAIYTGVNVHNAAERVAIKTILPEPGADERFGKMLLDEANALMRVRHDAVVPYRTYGRIGDTGPFYLVLEFIDGETLGDFYARRKLTEPELFALGRRLAAGLQSAHDEGLVHRDVSPDNVLLPQSQLDKATLIDFGIAKIGDMEDMPDAQFVGKLSYAAPEQFVRGARIGPFTDIYSLALVLAAASRGKSIPLGRTVGAAQEARRGIPELPDVPVSLVSTLQRMLEPHPPDRPQSMREVIALLDAAERGPVVANPTLPLKETAKPAVKSGIKREERAPVKEKAKRRGGGGLVSVLLALLIGGGAAGGLMYFEDDIFGKPKDGVTPTPGPGSTPPQPPAGPSGPSGPTEPPVTPPVEKSRPEQLAETVRAYRSGIAATACTVARVDGADDGTAFKVAVDGIWRDEAAVRRVTDEIAKTTGSTASLKGETFDAPLCTVVDQVKPLARQPDISRLTRPNLAGGADRSVVLQAKAGHGAWTFYLLEANAAGQIVQVLDLSTPASRAAIAGLTTLANGDYEIRLTPTGPDANTDQTLLIAVTSAVPLSAVPRPMALKDWVATVSSGSDRVAVDLMPRDGVAPFVDTPPPPPPPPPPTGETPAQLLAKIETAIRAKLDAVSCNLVRLDAAEGGPPFSFGVNGVWQDAGAVQAAVSEAAAETGAAITVSGDIIDGALCPALNTIRKTAAELGAPVLAPPVPPAAPDRTTTVVVAPRPGAGAVYLLEADRSGLVATLADLSSPEAIARAKASGIVEDAPGGTFKVKLRPPSDTANVDASLLLTVSAASPLPASAAAEKQMPLDAWLGAIAALPKDAVSFDVVERLGVPAAAPSPPPPPPSGGGAISQAIRDRFTAVDCSFISLSGPAGAPKEAAVNGIWGKTDAVQEAADASAAEAGFPFVLKGEAIAARHCAALNGLDPWFVAGAAQSVAKPKPTGKPDRTSEAALTLDPAFPHFYVLLIDAGGQVRSLIELTDAAKLAQRIGQGVVLDDGGGRYRLLLPPYSKAADSGSQLLVTVMTSDPLPADAFGFSGVTGLKAWIAAVGTAAGATKLRVDAAEYIQAPP
ncbi:Serine/threonine-protein kinase PknD [Alphaproteobacteria bacterium SO-S41]|nr:Serine/threonine-protein kinase PknD [Alphaproteobacteria bacterium SO-S41]